jgi:ABC-2 type transport system ATP-binding protein
MRNDTNSEDFCKEILKNGIFFYNTGNIFENTFPMHQTEKEIPAVQIENLSKYLDGKQVLFDINLSIEAGLVFGFLGPNGAGKTTTMKTMLGLIQPDNGKVSIFGDTTLSNETKGKIGFMPENTYLYKYLTGREFLRFNGKFFQIPDTELDERIEEILQKV